MEFILSDTADLSPEHLHKMITGMMYDRRSQMKPFWNAHVVAGVESSGAPFLGFVDVRGVAYKAATVATGYGAYIAQPLLRKATEGRETSLSEAEAKALLEECMRVLYYRDARSLNRIQLATVSKVDGVRISSPYELQTDWSIAHTVVGY